MSTNGSRRRNGRNRRNGRHNEDENLVRDIYMRVSRVMGREGDSYQTLEIQEEACRKILERRGLQLGLIVTEEDVSGGKRVKDRRLEELVLRCENGDSGGIVCFNAKRFARSISEGTAAIKRIKEVGCEALDSYGNSTIDNSLTWNIYLSIGEDELEKLTDQWYNVRQNVIDAGHWPGMPPLGYIHPGKRSKLEVDPKLAPVIVELFELRLQGWTIKALWEHLNVRLAELAKQYPAEPRYRPYTAAKGVHKMLRNKAYLGEIHVEGFEPNVKRTDAKRSDDDRQARAHDPIVDRDLFDAVQRMIKPRPGRNGKSERLLARLGILVCKNCGSRMSVTHSKGGGSRQHDSTAPWLPTYRCQEFKCDVRVAIQAVPTEQAVWEWAWKHKGTGKADVADKARKAAAEFAEAQAKLSAYLKLVSDTGTADEESAMAEVVRLKAVRDEKRAAHDQQSGRKPKVVAHIPTRAALERLEKDDPKLAMDFKRQLIKDTMECAIVHLVSTHGEGPQRIEIVPIK